MPLQFFWKCVFFFVSSQFPYHSPKKNSNRYNFTKVWQKPLTSDTAENSLRIFTSPFPGNKFTHFITEADKNVCVSFMFWVQSRIVGLEKAFLKEFKKYANFWKKLWHLKITGFFFVVIIFKLAKAGCLIPLTKTPWNKQIYKGTIELVTLFFSLLFAVLL